MLWPTRKSLPRSRFAILFPGRTGSSHLVSCLSSHPAVLAEGEALVRRTPEEQRDWIAGLYDTPRAAPVTCVGFKTKPKDAWDLEAFGQMLRARQVRIISMRRQNLVKLAVSALNAKRMHAETGRWNQRAGAPRLGPLRVEPAQLEAAIESAANAQATVASFVASLALPTLELDYEGLLADERATLDRVSSFLEIERRPMTSAVEKSTEDDLRQALAEFDALAAHFAAGPHGRHFLT